MPKAVDVLERQLCQCLDSRADFVRFTGRQVRVQCVRCEVLEWLGVDDPHLVKP